MGGFLKGFSLLLIVIIVVAYIDHTVDYHIDDSVLDPDKSGREAAIQQSESDGAGIYTDSRGETHYYENGEELS